MNRGPNIATRELFVAARSVSAVVDLGVAKYTYQSLLDIYGHHKCSSISYPLLSSALSVSQS